MFMNRRSPLKKIKEHRHAEDLLRKSKSHFRTLIESFPSGAVALLDQDLRYILAGGEGYKKIGINPSDLLGKRFSEVWPAEICDFFEPVYADVLCGEKQVVEYHFGGSDWLVHVVPTLAREKGDVETITILVVDITDFKKLEKEIRLVGERLEFLLSQNPAIIYSANPDCEFETTFISKNLETIHGYLPEKYYRYPHFWMNINHPEDIDEALKWVENIDEATKQINKSLMEKGAFEVEYHLKNQDGSYCWIQDRGRLIYDDAGNALEMVGCMIDVTERKQTQEELNRYRHNLEELVKERTAAMEKEIEERKLTEQSLRESEERFRQLVENIHQVFWMWDIKTEIMLYVSPAYEKIWGKNMPKPA